MDQDSITIITEKREDKIKVILIGDQCVGKSSLMEKMLNIETKFNDKQCQSVDFFISRILMPDGTYQKIYVWITSGEIKNIAMVRAFLIQCNIYIIAFSLNNQTSFENALNTWFTQCAKNNKQPNTYYYFLGTMCDMERNCLPQSNIVECIKAKSKELEIPIPTITKAVTYDNRAIGTTRGSEIFKALDTAHEFEKSLPPNIFYAEVSARDGINMVKAMAIFTKIIQQSNVKVDPRVKKLEEINASKRDVVEIQDSNAQSEGPCCSIF